MNFIGSDESEMSKNAFGEHLYSIGV